MNTRLLKPLKRLLEVVGRREGQGAPIGEHIPDDVVVFQLFQKRNLADGSAWHTLVFGLETDLLQGDDEVRAKVARLVHDSVGSCSGIVAAVKG